jgi:hypothetical protein
MTNMKKIGGGALAKPDYRRALFVRIEQTFGEVGTR